MIPFAKAWVAYGITTSSISAMKMNTRGQHESVAALALRSMLDLILRGLASLATAPDVQSIKSKNAAPGMSLGSTPLVTRPTRIPVEGPVPT
jgi:hypothetical protein